MPMGPTGVFRTAEKGTLGFIGTGNKAAAPHASTTVGEGIVQIVVTEIPLLSHTRWDARDGRIGSSRGRCRGGRGDGDTVAACVATDTVHWLPVLAFLFDQPGPDTRVFAIAKNAGEEEFLVIPVVAFIGAFATSFLTNVVCTRRVLRAAHHITNSWTGEEVCAELVFVCIGNVEWSERVVITRIVGGFTRRPITRRARGRPRR